MKKGRIKSFVVLSFAIFFASMLLAFKARAGIGIHILPALQAIFSVAQPQMLVGLEIPKNKGFVLCILPASIYVGDVEGIPQEPKDLTCFDI